jgi:hypothetical protein
MVFLRLYPRLGYNKYSSFHGTKVRILFHSALLSIKGGIKNESKSKSNK